MHPAATDDDQHDPHHDVDGGVVLDLDDDLLLIRKVVSRLAPGILKREERVQLTIRDRRLEHRVVAAVA